MELLPKLEIASFNKRIAQCHHYSFFCRLFIPASSDQIAMTWLNEKSARILATDFQKPYFVIVFGTNNSALVKAIQNKYGSSEVDAKNLCLQIESCKRRGGKAQEVSSDDDGNALEEYCWNVERQIREYVEDYSNAVANSRGEGWFYDEPFYDVFKGL